MPQAALAPIPFEKESPLDHDSPALSTDIYNDSDERSPLHDSEIIKCPPQIICSPKRTGKTTLTNHISNKQQQISVLLDEEDCDVLVMEFEKGASERTVREILAWKLQAPADCDTLAEMMRRSELINQPGHRVVVAIGDADNLSNTALRWLLYSIRQFYSNPLFPGSLRCQIIIDGSFALESITTPDSEFPLPQIFPRDFTKAEQFSFVQSRFSKLNMSVSDKGCHLLWNGTRGDKYLTQAVCLNLLEGLDMTRDGIIFDEKNVSNSIERFLAVKSADDPLKFDWVNSFVELSSHFHTHEFELESLLRNEQEEWDRQSEATRIAYQGGMVRRTAQSSLETRPFVRDTFEQLRSRVMQVRTVMDTAFVAEGVADVSTGEAKNLVKDIMKAAYFDQLRTLHVGSAVKVNDAFIEVECQALGQGSYRGTWEVTTDSSIKIGDELWVILWYREEQPGNRSGEIRTFPVKPLNN